MVIDKYGRLWDDFGHLAAQPEIKQGGHKYEKLLRKEFHLAPTREKPEVDRDFSLRR
jgi:hypothetical protein